MLRGQRLGTLFRAQVCSSGHGQDDAQGELSQRGTQGSEVRQYHRHQLRREYIWRCVLPPSRLSQRCMVDGFNAYLRADGGDAGCWGPCLTMTSHAALGVVRAGVPLLRGWPPLVHSA